MGYTSAPASISAAAVRWVLDVVLENLKQPVSVEIATYRHSAIRFVTVTPSSSRIAWMISPQAALSASTSFGQARELLP